MQNNFKNILADKNLSIRYQSKKLSDSLCNLKQTNIDQIRKNLFEIITKKTIAFSATREIRKYYCFNQY